MNSRIKDRRSVLLALMLMMMMGPIDWRMWLRSPLPPRHPSRPPSSPAAASLWLRRRRRRRRRRLRLRLLLPPPPLPPLPPWLVLLFLLLFPIHPVHPGRSIPSLGVQEAERSGGWVRLVNGASDTPPAPPVWWLAQKHHSRWTNISTFSTGFGRSPRICTSRAFTPGQCCECMLPRNVTAASRSLPASCIWSCLWPYLRHDRRPLWSAVVLIKI